MWISDFSIKNPIVTIVLMLGLVIFGIGALNLLDTDEFPEVNPPVVSVSVLYPGASPETVEREVVTPIEDAIAGISGVTRMNSSSLDSFGTIIIEFDFDKDLQQATQDIRDKVSEIRADLPPEMEEPVLTRFDPNDFPIISLTLSSDTLDAAALTAIADPTIVGELQSVSGVASVDVVGGVYPELTVELLPAALEASGVSVGQVVQALQTANLAAPVGRVTGLREERTIRLQGRLDDAPDFASITVASAGGQLVRLGEVAQVRAGEEEIRSVALFNGKQAVGIDIVKATNGSTTAVSALVGAKIAELEKNLPASVDLEVVRDSGVTVEASVRDVQKTLIEGALLTVLVVWVFLKSWRSTVITGLALPVSLLAAFIMVLAFGFTLNTMSLLGLSLAVGILVDDAIVVRENIVRHMEMGKDHFQAAKDGTAEIGLAVAATTFSIVVVFVPVAFMGGVSEQWLGPMALTIASSVLVSLLVSFSLDPMLSAYWPDPQIHADGRRGFVMRLLDRFDVWLAARTENYKRIIRWALGHRLLTSFIATASFVGALAMPATGMVGSSFFPIEDRSEFILNMQLPPGASLEYTRAKVEQAVGLAAAHPEVRYTYATVGGQGGTVDEASIYVKLSPKHDREIHQDTLAGMITDEVDHLAGVSASVGNSFGNFKMIQIQFRGKDVQELARVTDALVAEVAKVPGAVDVGLSTRGQKPEISVVLDRDVAASLGVTVGQVAQALRPAFAGIDVGDWVDPTGKTRDVTVRFDPASRERVENLETVPLMVMGPQGPRAVPLGQIADITTGLGPATIQHLDRERVINVEANVRGVPLSEVVAGIEGKIKEGNIPPGVTWNQGGDVETQNEVFTRTLTALGVAVLMMYFILVVQFGSFLEPVPIMMSLPLSLIGVMGALYLTGSTLNLMSMIGITLLFGIVAKNAILLVDFAKWAEEKGMPRKEAIIEAGGTRLRPILMTSVAIVAGMLPVAIGAGEGADFRAPLGRAVIGGVITSTVLTLLVIPTLYDTLCDWRERAFTLFLGRKTLMTHVEGAGLGVEPVEGK